MDIRQYTFFDTSKGGAGYSLRFVDYAEKILDKALQALQGCSCTKACDKCLIDRSSQWHLDDLDRYVAIDWLNLENQNRTAVPEKREQSVT